MKKYNRVLIIKWILIEVIVFFYYMFICFNELDLWEMDKKVMNMRNGKLKSGIKMVIIKRVKV